MTDSPRPTPPPSQPVRPPRRGAALVTGAAVRLGRALMLSLARAGYNIALHYSSSQESAIAAAAEARSFGVACELFRFDLLTEPNPGELVASARARFPELNVLVNSASLYEAATIMATGRETLSQQFKVNFEAPFFLSQAFANACKASAHTGSIINILDNKIAFNQYQYAAYLLSKKTLAELTKLAAVELAPVVRTNGIAPGVILPADSRTADYVNWRVKGIPLKRQGSTENICKALLYILDNDFLNGQILVVDGGESLTNVGQNAVAYEKSTQIKQ